MNRTHSKIGHVCQSLICQNLRIEQVPVLFQGKILSRFVQCQFFFVSFKQKRTLHMKSWSFSMTLAILGVTFSTFSPSQPEQITPTTSLIWPTGHGFCWVSLEHWVLAPEMATSRLDTAASGARNGLRSGFARWFHLVLRLVNATSCWHQVWFIVRLNDIYIYKYIYTVIECDR